MSDDIALIFADEFAQPESAARRAVFLSALSAPQMQQYAAAGWQVCTAPGFRSPGLIDQAAVPARGIAADDMAGAAVISLEAATWSADTERVLARAPPRAVKVNAAFEDIPARTAESMVASLASLGYALLGCHWRDDNTYRLRSLSRIDRLEALGVPDWKHMNLIGVRDDALLRALLTVARLYVGEERRIAELKLSHAIRGDHIARLEEALMVHQRRLVV